MVGRFILLEVRILICTALLNEFHILVRLGVSCIFWFALDLPYIAHAERVVSRYFQKHWEAVKWILLYLKGRVLVEERCEAYGLC